jgi:hypothetical protein
MEQLISELAKTGGVAWILLGISLFAIGFLFKICREDLKDRIKDLKDFNDRLIEPINAIKQTVDLILNCVQKRK